MWKISRNLIFLIGMFYTVLLRGQSANAWIDYSQEYYKIKVAENGFYRITTTELQAAGVPVETIAQNRFQIFRNGVEQAILVTDSNNDGRLEYLEFYGEKRNGASDTELYVAPQAQPHTYYSLFSDTASYFLTWKRTGSSGMRMAISSALDPAGAAAEPYHYKDDLKLQVSNYAAGLMYGSQYELLSAGYDYGEGWTGANFGKNGSQTFTFNLTNRNESGPGPDIEVLLTGYNNLQHLVDISVGPSSTQLRSIGQVSFERQYNARFNGQIAWSDISTSGVLLVKVTAVGLPNLAEQIAVSYARCEYPQELSYTGPTGEVFNFRSSAASRKYVRLTTSSATSRVFDITAPEAPVWMRTGTFTGGLTFVITDPSEDHKVLVVSEPKSVPQISKMTWSDIDPREFNYLIITHESLNQPVNGIEPVTSYAQFRSGASGGMYNVRVAFIDQVFDQFGYGDPGPVAIRNYIRYAMDGTDKYVFLIGKGTTPNYNYYRANPATTTLTHYIPTFGYPGSDILFGIPDESYLPGIAIARLSAYRNQDIIAYLDKVKEMESLPYQALWRKNLVQLSGGQTANERKIYANNLEAFEQLAEGDFLGGRATNIHKVNDRPVEVIPIESQVNDGVAMVTFFGHSSANVTDIEIGRVSTGNFNYSNQGKYPYFLVNGCNAGEIFATTFTFGEDWLHTPDLGAIGFVASSHFALSTSLKRYSDLFYEVAFTEEETFGSTAGAIQKAVSTRYFARFGTDQNAQTQVYQTLFQGDPVIRIFGANAPDYALDAEEIFAEALKGERILANADSFKLMLPVRNFGKTDRDSLTVHISRTLADGSLIEFERNFARVLYFDTLEFVIRNNPENQNDGNNLFVIQLDPADSVAELNEINNSATFELNIPKGNTIHLFPMDLAVVSDPEVDLVWQAAGPFERNREYRLELDTVPGYSSPFQISETLTGDQLMTYSVDLSPVPDSTTVFWRTRFNIPESTEDTTWVASSFTLSPGGAGWAQVHPSQFESAVLSGVTISAETGLLSFEETVSVINVNTHGTNNESASYQLLIDGINYLISEAPADPECKKKNAINAVVFDKETSQPYRPFGIVGPDVSNDLVCGRLPQMIHNFDQNDVLGTNRYLDSLISTMETGDMILLFSYDSVAYSNWDAHLKISLNNVGISNAMLNDLTDGQPVIFLGTKGAAPGTAKRQATDDSTVPVKEQAIELIAEVTGRFSSGNMVSPGIGPAKSWNGFTRYVYSGEGDEFGFVVYGLTGQGEVEELFASGRLADLDLSSVSADQYPYLRIRYHFTDLENQTPPQLGAWGVDYVLPPEGILLTNFTQAAEVQEGEPFARHFSFINLSEQEFEDSLIVNYTVTNVQRGSRESHTFHIAPTAPGDTTHFETPVATRGKSGANNLLVRVTAPEQEMYTINNTITIGDALTVTRDETNPVLDVTFDGGYILDGDIVSPDPHILIRFRDDNPFLFKDDTTGMVISLKQPCEGCDYQRVNFGDKLTYVPASEDQDFEIHYVPGPLEDGVYYLKVKGTDESGNQSGQDYEISFEVINESSITHFYPYPNPFSTSTRFVFTLTGSEIPDQIKIQIMTVSGRVVREITGDEIGPVRIGNNITRYAWDGRDEYGDLLANGLYLYKVFIRQNGETLKHRNTSADRGFKHGFGKMYILR